MKAPAEQQKESLRLRLFNKLDRPLSLYVLIVVMLFFLLMQYIGKSFRWCFTWKPKGGES